MPMTPVAGDRVVNPLDPLVLEHILQTIRSMESGSNYTALNKTASASGAYQYIDGTWRKKAEAVPGASAYPRAYQAPKAIQDAVAKANVIGILASTGNHLAGVPVMWYAPAAWGNEAKMNSVGGDIRYPKGTKDPWNNSLTVRQYAEAWIKKYDSWVGYEGDTQNKAVDDSHSLFDPLDILTGAGKAAGSIWEGLATPLDVLKELVALLTTAGTWIRVVQVVGGVVAIVMGIMIVAKVSPTDILNKVPGPVGAATSVVS